MGQNKPNKALQDKLRAKIHIETFAVVARQVKADGRTLARYLADLPMRLSTFRGIEALVADALSKSGKSQTPSSRSTEAAEDGLRR